MRHVQSSKLVSDSVVRIEEYIVSEISAFKSQFCSVFVHIREHNALKSLEKEVILSWKSLENQWGWAVLALFDLHWKLHWSYSAVAWLMQYHKTTLTCMYRYTVTIVLRSLLAKHSCQWMKFFVNILHMNEYSWTILTYEWYFNEAVCNLAIYFFFFPFYLVGPLCVFCQDLWSIAPCWWAS